MAPRLGSAVLLLLVAASAPAADWPAWRFDANRSSASSQELPARMYPQWARVEPPLTPAWPDQSLMPFDAAYEPVVAGKILYFGSSRTDSVTAVDTATGEMKWRFHAEGPVRFAPLAWEGRLYVVSDDGYLYCLDAAKGTLLWKFRGGPSDRKIMGNGRLISTWPARGAPVIADGTVYFAASIWPFMGIFIHALDARNGRVIWTNDGDGSTYMKQPHNADSFAGVAPQGPMAVLGDYLLVTGGRSVPACYDRKTGKLIHFLLNENSKKGGGSTVAAVGKIFVNGGGMFSVETGKHLGTFPAIAVLTPEVLYGYEKGVLRAYDLAAMPDPSPPKRPAGGLLPPVPKPALPELASLPLPGVTCMIRAGDRLYLGMAGKVVSLSLPLSKVSSGVDWSAEVEGTVASLVAADDRLFAVTLEGRIVCFGRDKVEPLVHRAAAPELPVDEWTERARQVLESARVTEGYCVAWGLGSGRLVEELARQSKLHVVVVEPDPLKVRVERERLNYLGLAGELVAVHHADPRAFDLPPYFASLMVSEEPEKLALNDVAFVRGIYQSLRPYGGTACFALKSPERLRFGRTMENDQLAGAVLKVSPAGQLLIRSGALPGAGNWTHEHADAGNSRVSTDALVRAPLGLLWFGGSTNDGLLPRHGHGPQPQVIDGRIIIEGVDKLRALDIYTGRLLWETQLPGLGARYNNLLHQPGANAGGTNYISTSDGIYVAYRDGCVILDPETGRRSGEFRMPGGARWGYINILGDYLIGGTALASDLPPEGAAATIDPVAPGDSSEQPRVHITWKQYRSAADTQASSTSLVVMDRHTGKLMWEAPARGGFRHNAICAGGGRLYAIDRDPATRGKKSNGDKLILTAFDLKTGARLWEHDADVFGTFLAYSAKHDVLVESGRMARDTLPDELAGMRAFRARSGDVLWYGPKIVGPAMLHGDIIIRDKGATELLTGKPVMKPDPLTGELVEWTWSRNYGCNTPAAAENLMTFRSGAAGYCDLAGDSGTGNFGGIRSGCTNNLVVANGVLAAPDYTRTCTCSYQNQTSLALVPMPEAEMWTSFGKRDPKGVIKRLGLNFGAVGDRKADDGTLWLEYPSVGGASPTVNLKMTNTPVEYFRHHASRFTGGLPWVVSSGVKGIEGFTITLAPPGTPERRYTVRLHFAEPESIGAGERVFGVSLQGKQVLDDLDIVKEAGGAYRGIIKEFRDVVVGESLTVHFDANSGTKRRPLICGIEMVLDENGRARTP
jgi:outer membrane protein assembly factor BamB